MAQPLPDWLPDWAIGIGRGGPVRGDRTGEAAPLPLQGLRPVAQLLTPRNADSAAASLIPSSHTPDTSSNIDLHNAAKPGRKERTVAVMPHQNRTLQRKLQGIHLFVSSPEKERGG